MTHFLPVRLQSGDVDPSFPLPNCPAPLGALSTLGSKVSCSWEQRKGEEGLAG